MTYAWAEIKQFLFRDAKPHHGLLMPIRHKEAGITRLLFFPYCQHLRIRFPSYGRSELLWAIQQFH
jgi:hypothetical protein